MSSQWPPGGADPQLEYLQTRYFPDLDHIDMAGLLHDPLLKDVAIVSSFGAESAALLHYVAGLRGDIPVVFLETGKHFPETLAYRDRLAVRLGLEVITVTPDAAALAEEDPHGALHLGDPNMCCTLRKTFPLQDALRPYGAWISGRKRFQATSRAAIPLLERDGEKIKCNPLALWTPDQIAAYFEAFDLPPHPLVARGYPSIGCAPCTRPVSKGEDPRAGRWAHLPDKTECGIHLGPDGRFARATRSESP